VTLLWIVVGIVVFVVLAILGTLGVLAWLEVRAASGKDSGSTS
jgi:hypothetical protein